MWLCAIRDLIAHARLQIKNATIFEFGPQRAAQTQQDVTLFTPVIREIAGCVFDHSDPDGAELLCPPKGFTCCAGVFSGRDY